MSVLPTQPRVINFKLSNDYATDHENTREQRKVSESTMNNFSGRVIKVEDLLRIYGSEM